ncbi:Uncharacterised protein [Escherichia coli]|uniref:Uncharacterized protein n=1 Tax=Escherichia coli TaxID=562 RepID=A0A376U5R6_ECOLX|nr:Uncharacterised protein [Escherichia coli]
MLRRLVSTGRMTFAFLRLFGHVRLCVCVEIFAQWQGNNHIHFLCVMSDLTSA